MRKRGSPLESSSSTNRSQGDAKGAEPPADAASLVGRLGRPNGLKGFLGLYVEGDDLVHFRPGSVVAVGGRYLTVRALRRGNKGHEVAFEGVTDRSGAESLRGADVVVAERRQLGDDEFWPSDLVGLTVEPGGGEVVGVEHGPAQDRLVIQRGELRLEIPFVRDLVPVVDVEGGFVEIVEIEGLNPP